MKLTKILSNLLFVPLALCATIPESKTEASANTADTLAQLEHPQMLLTQGLSKYFAEAQRLVDEAILKETKRLDMEDGPTNLFELLDMMFLDQTFSAAQVSNSKSLLGLVNGLGGVLSGVVGGLTGVVGGVLNGVTGAVDTVLTGGNNIANVNGTIASTNTTSGNPLSTVVGGLGNVIGTVTGIQSNGTASGGLGGLATNVVGGLLNTTTAVVDELSNAIGTVTGVQANGTISGGLGGLATGVVGGLVNTTSSAVDSLGNATSSTVGDLLNGTSGAVSGLLNGTTVVVGDILNGTTGVVGDLLNGTTGVVGGLLNGTAGVVGGLLNTTSGIVSGLTDGTLTVPSLIDQIVNGITHLSGSDNPIGKFILGMIAYLSSNHESAIVNFIKFSTFVYAVVNTFVQLATVAINISEGIKKAITEAIIGAIGRLILTGAVSGSTGIAFGRFQNMAIDELPNCQDTLFQIIHDQTLAGTSYALEVNDVVHDVVSKVCAIDPYFLVSVMSNPTEFGVRTAINLITKVIADHNA